MSYPVYTTQRAVNSDGTQRYVATLLAGDPAWSVIYDSLDAKGQSDLAILVAANGGTLPLSSISVAQNTTLNNGRSWYETYVASTIYLPASFATTSSASTTTTREVYSNVIILGATTSAAGNTFVAFSAQACLFIDIVNNSGTDIEYQRNGAGTTMSVKNGQSRLVQGVTNASQIAVRRIDLGVTQVTVNAEAFVS